jgi:rubrerythrin
MKINAAPDAIRNLTWKLNWYRQSELEGALLLGRMVGMANDHDLIARLTRHAAEEAEHSRIWADVIEELELPGVRIFRSYQSFYLRHGGPPATLVDVLAFTHIFEQRVHRRFHEELRRVDTPAPACFAFQRMIQDEKDHLAWVADWLGRQPEARAALRHYSTIDRQVFAELQPYEDCLWKIPGLGRECADVDTSTQDQCGSGPPASTLSQTP